MAGRLIVIGATVVDRCMWVERLPGPAESVNALGVTTAIGGKAANQAAAAARCGCFVQLVSTVGNDADGAGALGHLAGIDVDVTLCAVIDSATGMSFVTVDRAGRQHVTTWAGASAGLERARVERALRAAPAGSVVSLQGEIADTAELVELAHGEGCRVVVNASPTDPFLGAFPWELIDVVILNEQEHAVLKERTDNSSTRIVTRGARGAELHADGVTVAAWWPPPVHVIDTTGAGDALAGVFAGLTAERWAPAPALRWAVAAASISVQHPQCVPSYPCRAEIDAMATRIHRVLA